MSTAITVYDHVHDPTALVESLGKSMYEARMFGCTNEAQGRVLALACIAEKKNPIEIARTYHIIDGKLSMRSDAMLAEFRKRGGKVKWLATGDDGQAARAKFVWEGDEIEIAYTLDDAKRAGLIKDKSAWVKDPGSMLRARTISKGVRMLAPEIVAGYYTPEELSDGEESNHGGMNGSHATNGATAKVDPAAIAKSAAERLAAKNKTPEVIEGEFTTGNVDAQTVASPTDKPPLADGPSDMDPCTPEQRKVLANLFIEVGLTPEQQAASLEKRKCQTLRNLTVAQANEFIDALRRKLATMKPKELPPAVTVADDNGPCTPEQVDQIKYELHHIGEAERLATVQKLRSAMDKKGILSLAELTWANANQLLLAIKAKAIDEFFRNDLEKFKQKDADGNDLPFE